MSDNKSDTERLGLFKDSSYISIGDPYPNVCGILLSSLFRQKKMKCKIVR